MMNENEPSNDAANDNAEDDLRNARRAAVDALGGLAGTVVTLLEYETVRIATGVPEADHNRVVGEQLAYLGAAAPELAYYLGRFVGEIETRLDRKRHHWGLG